MSDETITYRLKSPVRRQGKDDITEITLQEPSVADLIFVEKKGGGAMAQTMALLQRMSNVADEDFAKIKARDIKSIKSLTDEKWGDELGKPEPDGEISPS